MTLCPYSHDAGRIEAGDIVVIADSGLGSDDGNLGAEQLALIGIKDSKLMPGDMLTAVGVYKKDRMPVYKYVREHLCMAPFGFEKNYEGVQVGTWIDTKRRETAVCVNGLRFVLPYFYAVGHMAVVDGKTKKAEVL